MTRARRLEGPCAPLFYSAAALLLLCGKIATAQTIEFSTLELCAGLETNELKLACFEAIIAAGMAPVATPPPEQAAVVEPEYVATAADPEPQAADVQSQPGATATAAMPSEEPADDFGQEQLIVPERKQKTIIRATVTEVSKGYNKTLYFHMADGQVWRQIEPRRLQYPRDGEFEVNITKGTMGEYRLRIGDDGRLVRIRRIK